MFLPVLFQNRISRIIATTESNNVPFVTSVLFTKEHRYDGFNFSTTKSLGRNSAKYLKHCFIKTKTMTNEFAIE